MRSGFSASNAAALTGGLQRLHEGLDELGLERTEPLGWCAAPRQEFFDNCPAAPLESQGLDLLEQLSRPSLYRSEPLLSSSFLDPLALPRLVFFLAAASGGISFGPLLLLAQQPLLLALLRFKLRQPVLLVLTPRSQLPQPAQLLCQLLLSLDLAPLKLRRFPKQVRPQLQLRTCLANSALDQPGDLFLGVAKHPPRPPLKTLAGKEAPNIFVTHRLVPAVAQQQKLSAGRLHQLAPLREGTINLEPWVLDLVRIGTADQLVKLFSPHKAPQALPWSLRGIQIGDHEQPKRQIQHDRPPGCRPGFSRHFPEEPVNAVALVPNADPICEFLGVQHPKHLAVKPLPIAHVLDRDRTTLNLKHGQRPLHIGTVLAQRYFLELLRESALPVQVPLRLRLSPGVALRRDVCPVPHQHLAALGIHLAATPRTQPPQPRLSLNPRSINQRKPHVSF